MKSVAFIYAEYSLEHEAGLRARKRRRTFLMSTYYMYVSHWC